MAIRNINKLSRLFQPVTTTIATSKKSDVPSKSNENLLKYGFIKQVDNGLYAFLPLGLRVLNKLMKIVDDEMEKIGAQKILLPALTPSSLWKKTGRYNNGKELFQLQDRSHKQYILSPTHEESICSLISTLGVLSPKMFPLKLYQTSHKWRDEIKPRLGFLRSREFVMKDLYTFDMDIERAKNTYESVCESYENIFKTIGIPFVKAIGDPGTIGGSISHEYHYSSSIGEDTICVCPACQYTVNKDVCKDEHCKHCKTLLVEKNVAEVGHTFLLDTKYTEPLNVMCKLNNVPSHLVMGCFGLGLSRIFTVMAEVLSTKEELRWPTNLAPYTICIIPPKKNSKEDFRPEYTHQVIDILTELNIDAILDDRTHLTIGNRLMHARITGFPYVIVLGKTTATNPPLIEIHNINDSTNCNIRLDDIGNYFSNECNIMQNAMQLPARKSM